MNNYLGIAGKVGHDEKLVKAYNTMLDKHGVEFMLTMFERWADNEDIECYLNYCIDNLVDNGLSNARSINEFINQ